MEVALSPDGHRYLASVHKRVARPFHLRWLLPRLLGDNVKRWAICSRVCVVGFAILTAIYTKNPWMLCVGLLPGIDFNWRFPVLVDGAGMFLALAAALVLPHSIPLAIAIVLLAGCVRETTPVWASIYAWHPILLVGLIPVGIRYLMKQGDDVLDEYNAWILEHPFQAAKRFHQGVWANPHWMILPWGGLIAGLAGLTPQLAVALAAGYGQMLVATDSVRLYQWAAPVMALATTQVLPTWSMPFVVAAVVFNPWKGHGG